MTDLLVLLVIGAGFILTYRGVYSRFMGSLANPDPDDRVAAAGVGLLLALIWPFTLAGYIVFLVATPTTQAEKIAAAEERKRELAALQRDIAQREKDLGVGRGAH